jgi:hypothetical protein
MWTSLGSALRRPRDVVPALRSALAEGLRRFDAAVSDSLEAIAQRAERSGGRPIPDLRVPLAAVTALTKERIPRIPNREAAGHIEGRLALYREPCRASSVSWPIYPRDVARPSHSCA